MKSFAIFATICGALCLGAAFTQSWSDAYTGGVQAAKAGHWLEARDDFKQADKLRTGDVPHQTLSPGTPTEPGRWRDGALYSPNFLAAYSAYRAALNLEDADAQGRLLKTAATEFELLLTHAQRSRDAYYLLEVIYTRLGDHDKLRDLAGRYQRKNGHVNWRVDEEIVAPEEVAAMETGISSLVAAAPAPPTAPSGKGRGRAPTGASAAVSTQVVVEAPAVPGEAPTLTVSDVPHLPDKFALVIGQSDDQLSANAVPFATADAQMVRDGLINNGGYDRANVTMVLNGTAAQITDAAKALAARVPQDGVVLIYYAGPGICLNGKDYLVGSDATSMNDPETMAEKISLYTLFMQRGARIFAFYEVSRTTLNGYFFGSEPVQMGAISQMEATAPESSISYVYYNGHQVGIFALSFSQVLSDLRSNRVPIYDFGWQLYNMMRRGNTGKTGGASYQTCTLPVLNGLAADARF